MPVTPRRRAGRRLGPALAVLAVAAALHLAAGAVPAVAQPRVRHDPAALRLEAQAHALVNGHRSAAGLASLEYDPGIAAIARRHSEAMAAGTVPFGHDGAADRERRIGRTVPLAGMAENVAVNNAPAREAARMAVAGWLESPGHRANIEGDYDATGIGVARGPKGAWFFTQIFVKRIRWTGPPGTPR